MYAICPIKAAKATNIKVNGSSRSPEKNLSSGNKLIFPTHHISSTTNSGEDFTTGFYT